MTAQELETWLDQETEHFPGQTALMVADPVTGKVYHNQLPTAVFPSASLIKVPIMLTVLDQVRQGQYELKDPVPVSSSYLLPDSEVFEDGETFCSMEHLITWMIIKSDNVSANVLLDWVGMDAVNDYCQKVLGLEQTACRRKMLDFEAAGAGLENVTSVADQFRTFSLLYRKDILTPELCELALSILCRQRSTDAMLRYLCGTTPLAHKTGSLDGVAHDCGLFLDPEHPLFVGLCSWAGPSPDGDPVQLRYLGRLGRAIHHVYVKED